MDGNGLSKKGLFLLLSGFFALFWIGAWFFDGYGIDDTRVLFIPPFLAIVFGILGVAVKDEPKEESTDSPSPKMQSPKYQDLLTIKELLDSGIITQEEYDEQKKRILEEQ